jgi:hypothetical protein
VTFRFGEHADDRAGRLLRPAVIPTELRRRHRAVSAGPTAKDVSVELAPKMD